MKKTFAFLLLSFAWSMMFGQSNYKIDNTLLNKTNQNEGPHRIIVVMAERYDDAQLAQKTAFMNKAQRRDFVIAERKAFCQASQAQVIDFLEAYKNANLVSELKPFWSFNGFSCTATTEVIAQLAERKDVAMIYSNELRNMIPENEKPKPATSRDMGWHVSGVYAPDVWNYNGTTGYTGNGVIVAMIDSGVNYNHIDIANSMWDGGTEFPHHGYDIVNNDNNPMDDHGHGSHTAGIVAGQGTAGTQTGVAPGAKIMAIKVLNAEGEGEDADLIAGVEFALEHGADLINISLSAVGAGPCSFYRDCFVTCLDAGIAAAVAAGNEGQTQYAQPIPYNISAPGNCPPPWLHPDQESLLPGGLSAVISVGATDINDEHCDFSSVGPTTWSEGPYVGDYHDYPYVNGDANKPGLIRPDLSAPGANVTSLNYATNNGYIAYDGTSLATPCVAGVLALLLEADPELSPAELDSLIELTSIPVGSNMKNNRVGTGRVNAYAAMNALFYHGPTNLTADFDGTYVHLSWDAAPDAINYQVFRDGIRISTQSSTEYIDHLIYGGDYTYYVIAQLSSNYTTLPSNRVTINKEVEVEVDIYHNTLATVTWNLPPCTGDGFESGDFYMHMWIIDQTSPWEISTNNPHEGMYCAKSTNTAMFSTGKISLAVNVQTNCIVRYYARISCFPLNGGGFFIDNVQYGETIKGEVPWTRYTVPLTPGNHILEWKYGNQLAEGEYENAYYIDDILVGNLVNIYRANCDGSNCELIASDWGAENFGDFDWDLLPIGQYKYGVSLDGGHSIAWSDCIVKDIMAVDEQNAIEANIYPNPANDQLTVECAGAKRITLVSMTGETLYDADVDSDKVTLRLNDYPNGMYFVRIQGDMGSVTKKVSVLR